jgi:hypothetical protein
MQNKNARSRLPLPLLEASAAGRNGRALRGRSLGAGKGISTFFARCPWAREGLVIQLRSGQLDNALFSLLFSWPPFFRFISFPGPFVVRLSLKSFPNSLDHLTEPVKVQRVENQITSEVDKGQPKRDGLCGGRSKLHDLGLGSNARGFAEAQLAVAGHKDGRMWRFSDLSQDRARLKVQMHSVPHVLVDPERLVCAPYQAAAKEDAQQDDAVVPLQFSSRHVELVAKPVDVEERGGQLVENEDWAVVIAEWSLDPPVSVRMPYSSEGENVQSPKRTPTRQ